MHPSHVLIVDDDSVNLAILVKILAHEGMKTTTARDGEEAMALLRTDPARFDAILLDRLMPRMDGMAVLREIKAASGLKNLPVIIQTAMNNVDEIMEGLKAGAFYYLTKPLNHKLVVAVVRSATEDYARWAKLRAETEGSHGALQLMDQSRFRFQTLRQCHELTRLIARACPQPERVVVGLSELMINALEHGNLGISYQEKTRLVDDHQWQAEVLRRQQLPEHRHKWARIGFERTEAWLRFEIEDEGAGFNWQDFIVPDPERLFDNHGRGILLARLEVFDQVEYQGTGNRVVAGIRTAGIRQGLAGIQKVDQP